MGERWKRIGIKMGSLARVCFCEQITFPDGEAEASGQWGRGWVGQVCRARLAAITFS